jgi:outer membrane receptor protein involved in Fe transport
VTPVPAYADGSTTSGGVPVDTRVSLHGNPWTLGFFLTDTLSAGKWSFNISGRFNRTSVDNQDLLPAAPGRPSITGHDSYSRFNPAFGVTYSPRVAWNAYASYSEASRAPTSIELGCADPNDPCNLPNAILSDPPLRQVVTKTVEAGVRSGGETKLHWNLGWFWAQNYHDLLFVASQQTGFGYFKNFGETRRQGVEAGLSRRIRRLTAGGNYTFVDATYQSMETIGGSANSSSDGGTGFDGDVPLMPGNRIPLIPHHIGKAFGDYEATSRLRVTVNFLASGSSYARGNENNLHKPDGVFYLGPGTSPGYGVTNLGARYQFHKRLEAYVQVNNLFRHRYYTGAQLGTTPFTNAGTIAIRAFPAIDGNYQEVRSTFYSPGAPIGAWGGIRFHF